MAALAEFPRPRNAESQPFDLERAKAGAKIVDGFGNPYRFEKHIPDAERMHRVVVLDMYGCVTSRAEDGSFYRTGKPSDCDLFMAGSAVSA